MLDRASLHDATLHTIRFDWGEGRCIFSCCTTLEGECEIIFGGVSGVEIPRKQPWGPSVSVNELREPKPFTFELELQSGDVLCISATTCEIKQVGQIEKL